MTEYIVMGFLLIPNGKTIKSIVFISITTISSGIKELNNPDLIDNSRIRKKGG